MKITIDIPKEFEQHFNMDKFKDSLLRVRCDTSYCFGDGVSGNYEIELLDMLIEAFEGAKIVEDNKLVSNPYPSFYAEDYCAKSTIDDPILRW